MDGDSKEGVFVLNNVRAGNECSKFFSLEARMQVPGSHGPSVSEVWSDPKKRRSAFRFFRFRQRTYPERISPMTFLRCIGNQVCSATLFRPSASKAIYELFDAKRVFDF